MPVSSAVVADHRRDTDAGDPSDAELIGEVRSGATDAYGVLYRRHLESARALARQLTGCPAEVDDLVAEAFTKVFIALRCGGGPDTAFRAYLLTVLRHTRYDRARQERRVEPSDDMTRHDPGVPWEDTAVDGLESRLATRAFTRLPERWRTVLWRTAVEQESPADVAPLLGLTPNGVSALAYRAREGLRQAYLQEHLSTWVLDPRRGTDGHDATLRPARRLGPGQPVRPAAGPGRLPPRDLPGLPGSGGRAGRRQWRAMPRTAPSDRMHRPAAPTAIGVASVRASGTPLRDAPHLRPGDVPPVSRTCR